MVDPELAQVAMIAWSADKVVSSADGACEAVLGRPADALAGELASAALDVSEAKLGELENRARAASGQPVTEFLTCLTRRDHPRVLRVRMRVRDGLTEAAVVDLSAMLHGAPPVQISALSSSLSHEIRNPLSSVKMAVQTLAKNPGHSERDQRRLTIANREIRTMERMLWLLSEYGRDTPPLMESMPLRQLVQEAMALIEPELLDRKASLEILEEPDLPRVRADAGRVRPVMSQLLLNMASAQPGSEKVPVRLRRWEGGTELVVEDVASALPPEERATLFEPFGSRLARGAGLSLASMCRVMQSLGGTMLAEGGSAPPTRFILRFPA